MTRLFGLIGYPLGHSFSASYFNDKFKQEGQSDSYRNFPLKEISEFEDLVKKHPDLKGLNVTVPYKEAVIPYLDALSETARKVGAVNTICFCRKKGPLGLVGHNTDVIGFERSLKEHLHEAHGAALVLGTGGSSKAVSYVLEMLNIPFNLVSRRPGKDRLTYDELNEETVKRHQLIVNTTPLGMFPRTDSFPPIPYTALTTDHLLFDLIYNPGQTLFLEKGAAAGARTVNGSDMLIYQAEGSWEIWNRNENESE